jgi:cell division protein FtsX
MESGSILGISSSLLVLVLEGWIVARFFYREVTWRAVCGYTLAVALAASAVCGINYLLVRALDVVDSSHGFMTLGLPVVLSAAGALVAISAFTFGTLSIARSRSHTPPSHVA